MRRLSKLRELWRLFDNYSNTRVMSTHNICSTSSVEAYANVRVAGCTCTPCSSCRIRIEKGPAYYDPRERCTCWTCFSCKNMYSVNGAYCLQHAQDSIDELSLEQLNFWFDGAELDSSTVDIDVSFVERLKFRRSFLADGPLPLEEAVENIDVLCRDHLKYWERETGMAIFEIARMVANSRLHSSPPFIHANEYKSALKWVYEHRMYKMGWSAEMRLMHVTSSNKIIWKEALTPTRVNLTEWSTWGDDV